ncbi:hypothetical protein L1987_72537 [Smallanthus sonchifolius]|uniref:Uncharacterized protein n=1 Tax=Smallanthus sonchifolius TaxID=185202 RepID=A0ACB9AWB0_9ASTR|nr:hypothetical protein L1987_72537 [Smallanthus sonchifolius]
MWEDEDLSNYVLQIDSEMELAEKTVKGISNSMNSFILKARKEQNNNLFLNMYPFLLAKLFMFGLMITFATLRNVIQGKSSVILINQARCPVLYTLLEMTISCPSARTTNQMNNFPSNNISRDAIKQLYSSCKTEVDMENSDRFSEPMVWIGIYIAIASLLCVLAMAADLLHGFRNKKLWFPSKYFSLNAASITVITITMKLPVDLTTGMPGHIDQATKLGSLAFMCTMMVNLMPSLASMDNNTLLANVIGVSILVITVIVNIWIQINTSVIAQLPLYFWNYSYVFDSVIVAYIYTALILLLLIIMISSSLTIPTSKAILDSKYQTLNKISSTHQSLQHIQTSKVEKLRRYVTRYWVMAETGSPQFVMASNPLSTASGLISLVSLLMNSSLVLETLLVGDWAPVTYGSSYKWSTVAIFITQSIGVVVGTIAPIFRCFSVFSFKLTIKWNRNHFNCFKVEMYWTQKLHEWKESPIPFLSTSRRTKSLIYNSKHIILSLCIGFQKVTSRTNDIDKDLSNYVLQIDNEMELVEKSLKGVSKSINSFLLKATKEQNNNLLELLKKTSGFKGVEIFDTDHVQPLLSFELVNNWSLPIVSLTCIIVALPDVPKDLVKTLFESVGDGLSYTHLVEENLNCASKYVNIRKASTALWSEVENKCKWLGNHLGKNVFKRKSAIEIIEWFSDKAKEIVIDIKESTDGELVENPPITLIAANSMYRITQTILLRYHSNIEPITKEQLFAHLNGMIADIFCACFTNIPKVITMKCHERVIEKREASVKVAAKLLGKTTNIIGRLDTCEVPSMDDDKMAYIDEWRLYLKQSIP